MASKKTKINVFLSVLLVLILLILVIVASKAFVVTKKYVNDSFSLSYPQNWTLNDKPTSKHYELVLSNLSDDPKNVIPEEVKPGEVARVTVMKYKLNDIGGDFNLYIEERKTIHSPNPQLTPTIKQTNKFKNGVEIVILEEKYDYNQVRNLKNPTSNFGYTKTIFYKTNDLILEVDGFVFFEGQSLINVKYSEALINNILNSFTLR